MPFCLRKSWLPVQKPIKRLTFYRFGRFFQRRKSRDSKSDLSIEIATVVRKRQASMQARGALAYNNLRQNVRGTVASPKQSK